MSDRKTFRGIYSHDIRHLDSMWNRVESRLSLATLIGLAFAATACSLGGSAQPLVTTCVLPADQSGSLEGHWKVVPVPIALDSSSQFTPFESGVITTAADTWNNFFAASLGLHPIDYGGTTPRISTAPRPAKVCGQNITSSSGNAYTGSVVIYKDGNWPYSHSEIALTTYCGPTGTPNGSQLFYDAAIELNYQDFFAPGKQQPDLQSIVLHELGHLVGVNHSCETYTKAGTPNCSAAGISPDYLAASMYPVFGFNNLNQGTQRRDLGANDQGRANCLYQGATRP